MPSFRVPSTMSTQAPTFTQPLQSVVALEGSAATFEAQVSGKNVSHFAIPLLICILLDSFLSECTTCEVS